MTVASRDFVRAEIADTELELKKEISDLRVELQTIKSDMKGFRKEVRIIAVGIAILIIFFQPFIAELFKGFFK